MTEQDLSGLRDQFLSHLRGYDRIFQLRYFSSETEVEVVHRYQMVEIPKRLLMEAKRGALRMDKKSKQNPKPGHCEVFDRQGVLKFDLYFDGGSERKLQIKKLKLALCKVLAEWRFSTPKR